VRFYIRLVFFMMQCSCVSCCTESKTTWNFRFVLWSDVLGAVCMWVTCFDKIDIKGLNKMYVLKQVTSKHSLFNRQKHNLHWEYSSLGFFCSLGKMKECHYIDSLAHDKDSILQPKQHYVYDSIGPQIHIYTMM